MLYTSLKKFLAIKYVFFNTLQIYFISYLKYYTSIMNIKAFNQIEKQL